MSCRARYSMVVQQGNKKRLNLVLMRCCTMMPFLDRGARCHPAEIRSRLWAVKSDSPESLPTFVLLPPLASSP